MDDIGFWVHWRDAEGVAGLQCVSVAVPLLNRATYLHFQNMSPVNLSESGLGRRFATSSLLSTGIQSKVIKSRVVPATKMQRYREYHITGCNKIRKRTRASPCRHRSHRSCVYPVTGVVGAPRMEPSFDQRLTFVFSGIEAASDVHSSRSLMWQLVSAICSVRVLPSAWKRTTDPGTLAQSDPPRAPNSCCGCCNASPVTPTRSPDASASRGYCASHFHDREPAISMKKEERNRSYPGRDAVL